MRSAVPPYHFRSRWERLGAAIARLPGRRFPIKGWIQVTELLHRRVVRANGEVLHSSPYGVLMRVDLGDYVQRNIFYDAWEGDELNLLLKVLRTDDVMIDVGANIGLFSLVAAGAVGPSGEVHAFEPVPGNFDRLSENVNLNGLKYIQVNKSAVIDRVGTVVLAIDEDMARTSGADSSGFFTVSRLDKPVREITASPDTVDAYVARELGDRQIRLIKIDVEGAEPLVLRGMSHTLVRHRVDVLMLEVSIYALSRSDFKILDIIEPLLTGGYELYRLGLGGLLWRWAYEGEPSIPNRASGSVGLVRGVLMGLQDLNRLFNLVAIRNDHPAVAGKPRVVPVGRLR